MSKIGSWKAVVGVCLVWAVLGSAFILTGCGKKADYTSEVRRMLNEKTGTWNANWEVILGDSTTKMSMEKVISETGDASVKCTLAISDVDSVVFNTYRVSDKWYLELSTLRTSLLSCKNAELVELGNKLPNNISFLTFSDSTLIKDYFADASEDKAGVEGVLNLSERYDLICNMFLAALDGNNTLAYSSSNGTVTMKSTDDLSSNLLDVLVNIDSYYDKYAKNLTSLGLASDYESKSGFTADKHNFLTSLSPIQISYEVAGAESMKATAEGTLSVFSSKSTGDEYDGTFDLSWVSPNYGSCSASCKYSYKSVSSVVATINSTEIDLPAFNESYFDFNVIFDTVLREGNVLGGWYLNADKSTCSESAEEKLVSSVKEMLGIDSDASVSDYIAKNSGSIEVDALMTVLRNELGVDIGSTTSSEAEVTSRYNDLYFENNGAEYILSMDESKSDSSLLVVHLRVLNSSEEPLSIKTKDFKLKDLGTNVISANVKTQLLEINPEFDTSLYSDELEIGTDCFVDTDLYFAVPDNFGYQDLYLGDDLFGNLVSY